MFAAAEQMLIQLIQAMPYLIALYVLFDFIGSWFFAKR